MQRLEVSGAVRLIYKSLGVKGLKPQTIDAHPCYRGVKFTMNWTYDNKKTVLSEFLSTLYVKKKKLTSHIADNTSLVDDNSQYVTARWGSRWRSWLRHYATCRKVACSIPDGVTGIFH